MKINRNKINSIVLIAFLLMPILIYASKHYLLTYASSILNVKIIEPISIGERECRDTLCTKKYYYESKSLNFKPGLAIGFYGFTANACIEGVQDSNECLDDSKVIPTYFSFTVKNLINTKTNSKITIVSKNYSNTPRLGSKSPILFVGNISSIELIKSFYNLINVHSFIFQAIAFIVIPLILFVSGLFKSSKEVKLILPLSILGMVCQVIFSHSLSGLFFGLGLNFLEFMFMYRFFGLIYLGIYVLGPKKLVPVVTYVLLYTLVCTIESPFFEVFAKSSYKWTLLGFFIVSVYLSFKNKRKDLIFFNIFYFHDMALFFNLDIFSTSTSLIPISFLPSFIILKIDYIKSFFISNIYQLKRQLLETKIKNIRLRSEKSNQLGEDVIEDFLALVLSIGFSKRFSICLLTEDGFNVYTKEDNNLRKHVDGKLPPVFARVIQTNEKLIWKNKTDLSNIYKNQGSNNFSAPVSDLYNGSELSCVIPLILNRKTIGAISFSKFSFIFKISEYEKNAVMGLVNIICEFITKVLLKIDDEKKEEVERNLEKIHENILYSCTVKNNYNEALLNFVNNIVRSLNLKTVILDVNQKGETSVRGFDKHFREDLKKFWNDTMFVTRRENKVGPIPVAYNENKVILINNVKNYEMIVSSMSAILVNKTETNQMAIVPLKMKSFDGLLIFMDASIEEKGEMEIEYFEEIKNTFKIYDEYFYTKEKLDTKSKILNEFIPLHIEEKIKTDPSYTEVDNGFMIMIDCRKSTKIQSVYSEEDYWSEKFKLIVSYFRSLIEDKYNGLIIREDEGDALLITYSTDKKSESTVRFIVNFLAEAKYFMDDFYRSNFSRLKEFIGDNDPKFRACISFGSINRSMMGDNIRRWGITGAERSNISKLESEVKKIEYNYPESFIFSDESVFDCEHDGWTQTSKKIDSNSREIFVNHRVWKSIIKQSA